MAANSDNHRNIKRGSEPAERPRQYGKSGKARSRRKKRRRGIFFRPFAYLLMLAAMALGISAFFKISEIVVVGNVEYSQDQIINASEIKTGDSLFFINTFQVTGKLFKALPYVNEAKITRKLPGSIIINIEESLPLASINVSGSYYLLNKNCKILEKTDYSGSIGTIAIKGLEPILPSVGDKLVLEQDEMLKLDYLSELLSLIEDKHIYEDITELDATSIANFTFRYLDRFTIEMGKQERLKYKLDQLDSVLEFISPGDTGIIALNKENEPHFIPD